MGIIYNNKVKETGIMTAYGLVVYGKINRYEWTTRNNESEDCLISIRITDSKGNDIFAMDLGNNCIMWSRVCDTMENFLYWIVTENPDAYMIEKQVYKSLCSSDSLFNHRILNKKLKAKRQEEEQKRIEERQEQEKRQREELELYCKENGLFYYVGYDEAILIKATGNHERQILAEARGNNEQMNVWVEFLEKHPEYHGAYIVKRGAIEDVLKEVK